MKFNYSSRTAIDRLSICGVFCAILAFAVLPAIAAEAPQLTVYSELDESVNHPANPQSEAPAGPGYLLALAILAEIGYSADVQVVPWTRVIHSLETHENVLAFYMTRTPEREDRFHWIGLVRPVNFKLWGLAERVGELPNTLEQAKDLKVSAIRGDVVEHFLIDKGFGNRVYLHETANAITMLRRGRIDLMPYIESGMDDYLVRKNEPLGTLVPFIDLEEVSTGHYIVMSKQSDPVLVQQLKDAFQTLANREDFWQQIGLPARP